MYGKIGGITTTAGGGAALAHTGMNGFALAGMAVLSVTLVMVGGALRRIHRSTGS